MPIPSECASNASAVVILRMGAYIVGVVRAPLTAVLILSETTASRGLMLSMFAAAFLGRFASRRVSRDAVSRAGAGLCHAAGGETRLIATPSPDPTKVVSAADMG
ncbi:chloride channel protein [uncultured Sphingomonas sp.]|uniref:chloride channel protein n=1 Tax=uncultured Sphingomonas sp. TaxID=158754 RepID=UPI0025F6CBCE|nr:chloride channel protein [uncultured Sphingomonas sp.]